MCDAILATLDLPVTVGIARTKTLAKLVSDTAKPFGALALMDKDAERALLERLPVTEVSGIANRGAARLAAHGITTCLELVQAERRLVGELIAATGEALWWELNGDPVIPLLTERPPHKVISRGGSLGGATADRARLLGWLTRNVERLVEELEYHAVRPGLLSLYLLHKNGREGMRKASLLSAGFDALLEAARWCFDRAWLPGEPVVRMHLLAFHLQRPGYVQGSLFDQPENPAVAEVKRRINEKMGRFAVRSGATLPLVDVYDDSAQNYDICDVRGKICF